MPLQFLDQDLFITQVTQEPKISLEKVTENVEKIDNLVKLISYFGAEHPDVEPLATELLNLIYEEPTTNDT